MKFKMEDRNYKGKNSIRIQCRTEGWETPKIKDILRLIQCYCVAEEYRYPQKDGFKGKTLFLDAVTDIGKGKTIMSVLKKYRVHNKKNADLLFEDVKSLELFRDLANEDMIQQMTLSSVVDPPKGVNKNAE